MRIVRSLLLPLASGLSLLALSLPASAQTPTLGVFTAQQDMGEILHPGSAQFDGNTYTVSGSGDNTWFKADDLHYVWKKVEGDVSLSAEIAFVGEHGNAHRKAMLMIRQSLDADSPYVDVARHGDGLTSLQYRGSVGAVTHEIETNASAPPRVRITRRGDTITVAFKRHAGSPWEFSGSAMRLPLHGAFYIGLAVCSHDKTVLETAKFSHVQLVEGSRAAGAPTLYSTLEVVPIASTDRRVVYSAPVHFEAPNWLHDLSGYLVNQDGRLERITTSGGMPQHGVTPVAGSAPVPIATGDARQINNDHGLSPDGTEIALSDSTAPGGSRVYRVPLGGGTPQRITSNAPSYWHGWSPDAKTIVFTGEREGNFDIYTMAANLPAAGGTETRLTTAKGLDDGPEYSPDGAYIYFNSERTGHMQIWRMHPDGSAQEQVTHEATNDWFPHLSPDGKWMVFVAYAPGVTGHPANQDVTLQLVSLADGKQSVLATLFGGQGTMNVPSWSPDSSHVAFVSYALVPEEPAE